MADKHQPWSEVVSSHKDRVADHISRTALQLAAHHGLAKVTMRDLAAQAQVSRASLYTYFSNVDQAISHLLTREAEAHLRHLQDVLDEAEPHGPLAQLRAFCTAQVDFVTSTHHTVLASQMDLAGLAPHTGLPLQAHLARTQDLLAAVLRAGAADTTFTIDPDQAHPIAGLILHLTAGARGLIPPTNPTPGTQQHDPAEQAAQTAAMPAPAARDLVTTLVLTAVGATHATTQT